MRWLLRLTISTVFALVMLAVHWLPAGQFLEREYGLPLLYALRGDVPVPDGALIIGLDNRSVHATNNHVQGQQTPWPMLDDCLPEDARQDLASAVNINQLPRALHACLLDALHARGARVIVFDISFNQERRGDGMLAEAMARAGEVLLFEPTAGAGEAFAGMRRRPVTGIAEAADGTMAFRVDSARGEMATSYVTRYPPFDDLAAMPDLAWARHTGQPLPRPAPGLQPIWMYGPPRALPTVQLSAVFDPNSAQGLPGDLSDRTVFIGASDPRDAGIDDHFPVPTSGRGQALVGGVELAATAFLNRLHGTMLTRPDPAMQSLIVFVTALLGALAVQGLAAWRLTLAIAALALGYAATAALAFSHALVWMPIMVPAFLTTLLLCLGALAVRYAFARTLVGRLVPKPIAAALLDGTVADRRAAKTEQATIMFTDLVGSTGLGERLSTLEYTKIVNLYYDTVTDLVEAEGGMVVEFQGDGIVAMFSQSVSGPGHAAKACLAAEALARSLARRNDASPEAPPLYLRIGINSGLTATGDIGARRRFSYKALGDVVTVAARLEQHGKMLRGPADNIILLSAATRDLAEGLTGRMRSIGMVALRGRGGMIEVFRMTNV